MSRVKFYTGPINSLDTKQPENGAIYFVNDNGNAVIAYDMNSTRYWISHPTVLALSEMSSTWTPKAGEIVVISNAYQDDGVDQASVKIGDGVKNIVELPYIGNDTDISALRTMVINHINDNSIHHTVAVQEHTYIVTPTPTTTPA